MAHSIRFPALIPGAGLVVLSGSLSLALLALSACDHRAQNATPAAVSPPPATSGPPATSTAEPATARDCGPLAPGPPREQPMEGGETHLYRLVLAAGQYLHLEVEQRGIDVAVTLLDDQRRRLVTADGLTRGAGREEILWWAETPGKYRLEVSAGDRQRAGAYRVGIRQLRAATEVDRRRVAAARIFAEGEELSARSGEPAAHQAIAKYEEALARWRELDEPAWQARTLHSLGYVHFNLRRVRKASETYRRALPFFDVVDDVPLRAVTLIQLGRCSARRYEIEPALDFFHRALPLLRQIGDHQGESDTANNLALLYDEVLREVQAALTLYDQALAAAREAGDLARQSTMLHNLGRCYASLGKTELALAHLEQALAIRKEHGNRERQAATLTSIGQLYEQKGQLDRALAYFREALALRTDERGRAVTLADFASVFARLGENEKARQRYEEALAIFCRSGDRASEATVLRKLGWLHDVSDPEQALARYAQALALHQALGDRGGEAATRLAMAWAERYRGNLLAARENVELAVALIDELRTKPARLDLRSTYFAIKHNYYHFYVDLLMDLHARSPQAGHAAEALAVGERARARSLLDLLNESGADLRRGADPELLARERELQRRIEARQFQRQQLLHRGADREQLAAVEDERHDLLQEYQKVRGRIRLSSPRYAALTQPRTLSADAIRSEVLDSETLLLEYQLGEERSFLWAVTPQSLVSYELPGIAAVEKTARLAYRLLTVSHERRYRTRAQEVLAELSEMVLGPVAGELGTKRLMIVSDGVLDYIPFAALPVPGKPIPLVAEHEVVSLPSASALAVLRRQLAGRPPAPRRVAVVADPVFGPDDPRLGSGRGETGAVPAVTPPSRPRERPQFARLSFSAREAEAIRRVEPEAAVFLGFDANHRMATSGELRQYRIVHIASHGELNAQSPELSGIVLSLFDPRGRPQVGLLPTHQIYHLDLAAELVVLSACQTALGEEIHGEGLVGLTQGFMYAGAAAVVVSLWNVNDRSTAELMDRFYGYLLDEQMPPAAALRAAQNAMRQEPQWQAPFYWAGFVLQGDGNRGPL